MLPFGERLEHHTPTARASLSRPVWINSGYQSTGTHSLVLQHIQELSPTGVPHTLGNVAAAEPTDVQIFDGDEAILLHQASREFVLEVPAVSP